MLSVAGGIVMSLEDIISYSFPEQTYESWRQKAEESLKGKSLDSLSRNTYENIQLKPLYSKEDWEGKEVSQFPGQGDYRRGSTALGYIEESWKIAQQLNISNVEQLKERLTTALKKGQNAVSFVPTEEVVERLEEVLQGIDSSLPFAVNAEGYLDKILTKLGEASARSVNGFIAQDPVSLHAKAGKSFADIEKEYARFAASIQKGVQLGAGLRTILIDTTLYHNGGANAVQELAIALATAVTHIEELKKHGLTVDEIVKKMVFHFAIGGNFFMELAKLRAARVLWSKITEAYETSEELHGQMEISAATSWFTKTVYDPYVNMLRAGNEAFAAVLGGVQYLHVSPFDEPEGESSEFSERIARNTQLLLQTEARLGSIIDPAGGSWYVESLTDELVEKAWSLFLDIEEKGGMTAVLESGWLQAQIEEVKNKRFQDIAVRKQTIVGTNKYANPQDTPLTAKAVAYPETSDFPYIKQERLAEPYEQLRKQAEQLAERDEAPVAGLLCLGQLKDHKARADFMAGFLSPGGIAAEKSDTIASLADALSFINEKKRDFYCLCASDAQYAEGGLQLVKEFLKAVPDLKLYVAGLVPEEERQAWLEAGIRDFITLKSNCYETLQSFLNEIEVEKGDE